jgi:hypothetical protein
MKTYHVVWEIELDADSPLEAAKLARAAQLDPCNTFAAFFSVYDYVGDETVGEERLCVRINLSKAT